MKSGLKKALSLLSAFCVAFSMTGCFDLYRTINKDKNINDLKAEISEGNFVEEWTGDIPAGKKVRYVLARDVNVGVNDIKNVNEYEYDDNGNRTFFYYKTSNFEIRREITYNDGGLITGIKQQYTRSSGSSGARRNYDYKFDYNGKGHLVYFKSTEGDAVYETDYEYDEEGHLVFSYYRPADKTTKYQNELPQTYYCVTVDPDFDSPEPDIVKRTYDENGLVRTEVNGNKTTTYEYSGTKMTGYSIATNDAVAYYDADGRILRRKNTGSGGTAEYTYNEHGDMVLHTYTSNGEVTEKIEKTYVYDSNGNKTSETEKSWRKTYKGEENTSVTSIIYTYDANGLLVTEEKQNGNGGQMYLKAYFYKAILVSE